jgi:rhodanese-related sulfurtransferase
MLIDVRTPEEYAHGHHDGAVNVPLETIETHPFEVPYDERMTLYCQSGGRARLAQTILAERGFKNTLLLNETGAY